MWSHPQGLSMAWVDEGGDGQTLWWGSGPGGEGRECRAVSGGGDGSETEILELWEGVGAGADRVALCPHQRGVWGRLENFVYLACWANMPVLQNLRKFGNIVAQLCQTYMTEVAR